MVPCDTTISNVLSRDVIPAILVVLHESLHLHLRNIILARTRSYIESALWQHYEELCSIAGMSPAFPLRAVSGAVGPSAPSAPSQILKMQYPAYFSHMRPNADACSRQAQMGKSGDVMARHMTEYRNMQACKVEQREVRLPPGRFT